MLTKENFKTILLKAAEKDIIAGEDGFFVFWPTRNEGAYSEAALRIIAEELARRNASWQTQLDEAVGVG